MTPQTTTMPAAGAGMRPREFLSELLAVEPVMGDSAILTFAAPDPDQRQQAQTLGVQLRPFAQVRGVAGNRQVGEVGKVAGTSARGALGGEPQRLIAAQTVGAAGHPRNHRRSTRPTG